MKVTIIIPFYNEEKRIVTGVMMSANTPIYRSNPDRFVLFKEETIKEDDTIQPIC